jgi:hypothetical protein
MSVSASSSQTSNKPTEETSMVIVSLRYLVDDVDSEARNPKDGREEAAALPLDADVNLAARAQERQNLLPLLIGECFL